MFLICASDCKSNLGLLLMIEKRGNVGFDLFKIGVEAVGAGKEGVDGFVHDSDSFSFVVCI